MGEVIIVSNMHERKAEMARRADAFIALPGTYVLISQLTKIYTNFIYITNTSIIN